MDNMSLRQRINYLLQAGSATNEIVTFLECNRSTVYKIKRMVKNGQDLTVKPRPGRPSIQSCPAQLQRLRGAIKRQPRRSLREFEYQPNYRTQDGQNDWGQVQDSSKEASFDGGRKGQEAEEV